MRVLLVDNYDSFTYNLYQLIAQTVGRPPVVVRNDDPIFRVEDVPQFDAVVISPGPGRPDVPSDFGLSGPILDAGERPVLGVCLGHQGICSVAGAKVVSAPTLMHGRLSAVRSPLFAGIPSPFEVVRYHSLIAEALPGSIEVLARTSDDVLMAVAHRERPQWGVQFHPESICTQYGRRLIQNFQRISTERHARRGRTVAVGAPYPDSAGACPGFTDPGPEGDAEGQSSRAPIWRLRTRVVAQRAPAEQLFEALFAQSDTAFWLDSSGGAPALSRFSFMGNGRGPYARRAFADVRAGTVVVETHAGRTVLKEGLFDWLKAEMARNSVAAPDLPFGFALGWVGYLGYELKAECGGADAHAAPDPDAGLLFADRGLAFDHARGEVWVMALEPGEGDDGAAETWMEAVAEALREVAPTPSSGTEAGQSLGPLQLRHDRDAYLRRIRKSLDAIAAGESYEVCLTNMLSASGRMPPLATYRELRRISPAPFAAYLRFGDLAVLSSSPERFLSITSAGQIEAKPIKGTRRRGCDEAEDRRIREELATCEKDRSENLMIVDLLRNDLGVCAEVGSVRVDKIFDVETYATVHQLVSTVAARLRRDVSPVDCVRAAFPGGSMTGAPKIRTMAIIDALEDGPRGIYSGALGYFSLNGAVDLSIVIRTLVMRPDGVQYGVGGAIVALSDPEEEYEEMAVKTSPLSRLTGQAFPGARYRDADGAAPPEHSGAEETQ